MRKRISFILGVMMISATAGLAFGEPLHQAIVAGDKTRVTQLIEAGADINAPSTDSRGGMTPLNYAAYGGHLELVKLLLDKGAQINARDDLSFTPLLLAAYGGHKEVQKELITRGADVKAAENSFGWTALHRAAANGFDDIIVLLLEEGADINARNKKNETPLTIAKQRGKTASTELLLSRGAKE